MTSMKIKKLLPAITCLALFTRDRQIIVTTVASRTGLGRTRWQKPTDNTIQRIAFTSRYLSDTVSNYSIGYLEILAVV